ncbi:DUF6602 domain-containing protein [Agrococcus beijingensis]|uniref:DUF6602 domain-containing protein n=1 Tax=Agrococcus beijingensis TaxID=3068634 RepID=UPI0027412512|nr:DUF6602 domain-containing protein [Agrococcus sp. REN33]
MSEKIEIRKAFMRKQRHLLAAMEIVPALTDHGTSIGEESEANWLRVLREFLPGRYGVSKGFVIDSVGQMSQQIDVLIYDPQYTYLFAETSSGDLYIPAESVYAVFEVKQEINKSLLDYAAEKIASVRRLHRTSVEIVHAGGTFAAKPPIDIIGGMLTTRSGWSGVDGRAAAEALMSLTDDRRVDLGCALQALSFELPLDRSESILYSEADTTLIFFLLRLFDRLRGVGTVRAVDIDAYMAALDLNE